MVTRSLGSLFSVPNDAALDQPPVSESSFWRRRTLHLRFALIAGLSYYAGTRVGFALTPTGQPNSAFWPPNAILLAVLLLALRKVWWAVLLAVVPAHLLAQLQAGVPLATAAAWLATNTSEALIGAFCIGQLVFGFKPALASSTPVLLFFPLALLMWATARFGSGGLSLCLFIISVISICFVIHGREPFPSVSLRDNLLSLQVLLCTIALPLMFVLGFMTEARHTQASLRRLSANLINAQELERTRIGRELHDDVNQKLAMLSIELQQLQENPSDVDSRLQELRQEVDDISSEVQALSHELHSSKLEYLGVVKGIQSWCKEFAERQRIEIDFRSEVTSLLPFEVGVSLLRVLQEAVHNAVKHSGVKHVAVQISQHSGEIRLTINDPGKGFDIEAATQGKGLGLITMRERVRLVHGTFAIRSRPLGGTTIDVRVPLSEDGSPHAAA